MLVSFFATNTLRADNRIIAGDDLYIADLIDSHDLIEHYRDAPPHAGLLRLRACGLLYLLNFILPQYVSHSSHDLPFKFSTGLQGVDPTQFIHCFDKLPRTVFQIIKIFYHSSVSMAIGESSSSHGSLHYLSVSSKIPQHLLPKRSFLLFQILWSKIRGYYLLSCSTSKSNEFFYLFFAVSLQIFQ